MPYNSIKTSLLSKKKKIKIKVIKENHQQSQFNVISGLHLFYFGTASLKQIQKYKKISEIPSSFYLCALKPCCQGTSG